MTKYWWLVFCHNVGGAGVPSALPIFQYGSFRILGTFDTPSPFVVNFTKQGLCYKMVILLTLRPPLTVHVAWFMNGHIENTTFILSYWEKVGASPAPPTLFSIWMGLWVVFLTFKLDVSCLYTFSMKNRKFSLYWNPAIHELGLIIKHNSH